jgi:hypothetical protein
MSLAPKHKQFGLRRSLKMRTMIGLCSAIMVLIVGWVLVPQQQGGAIDDADTQAIMKANFLFHFAAANEWPEEVKSGPFRMAIIGNERLFNELVDKYALKSIGAQSLEIVYYSSSDALAADVFAHVIYAELEGINLEALAERIANDPVLLVANSESALDRGALINFVAVGHLMRYEINAEKAAERGVLIGNRIMSWAVKSVQ